MDSQNQGGWDYDSGERKPASRKQRWRKISFIAMLLSLVGLVMIGTYNYKQEISKPEFCNSCHEMNEAYTAWQSTSHAKVDCLTCHNDISIPWVLYVQKMGVNRVGQKEVSINDQACMSCHSDTRVITPPMDLKIPHTLHLQKGVSCTTCHKTVTHGSMVQSATTASTTNIVPTAQGTKVSDLNRIPMSTCMKCHNGAMATQSCNACHEDKEPPASHKSADFAVNHGYTALTDVAQCNNCHQYDPKLQAMNNPSGNGWPQVQTLARKTDFCESCHQKRPADHQTLYTVDHGSAAKQDTNRCLTCHNQDTNGQIKDAPATNVTCNQCHYNQHPTDFLQSHPKQVDKSTQAKCFNCHDASSCNDCHNKTFRAKG